MSFLEQFRDKDVIFMTHCDLDGVGCYLIYKTYIEPIANLSIIEICDRPDIQDYDFDIYSPKTILLFTDISPVSREQYDKLSEKFKIIIVDHHKSARDFLGENLENYYYDETKCGAKLFFDIIRQETRVKKVIAQFVELVNTFDLYQTDSLLWKQAHDLSNIMYGYVNWAIQDTQTGLEKYEKFIDAQYDKFLTSKQFFLNVYEQSMARKAEDKEKRYFIEAKRIMKIRTDSLGNLYGYTEAKSKVSWIAHLILKENTKLDYLVIRSTFKDRKDTITTRVSLRALEGSNADCALIAERYEGGGHKFASSCEFKDIKFFEDFRKGAIHLI
jgi:oligoribonuclease NrnB/cAMP/cGMP phosphodiesterase (DHH superfamily)